MSRRTTAGGSSSSSAASSQYVDPSPHPGFVNLGNTCFLSSVLQATSATQSLRQLYHPQDLLNESTSKLFFRDQQARQEAATISNDAAFTELIEQLSARSKSPVLQLVDEEHGRFRSYPSSRRASATADHILSTALLESPEAPFADVVKSTGSSARSSLDIKTYEPTSVDLPLNTVFRQLLEKSWTVEDGKAGSSSKNNARKAPAINPKRLLSIMASKYDQYGDYAQQDGHELLRHLLDSLRMEELDVIKKIQPPSPAGSKRGKRSRFTARNLGKTREETLRPFVDNLFCGKLLSCVVCEGCRHVSHTYEDFYDISLSLRPDIDSKSAVKRDRMKSMADRWKRATTSKCTGNGTSTRPANDSVTSLREDLVGSLSDTEEIGQNTSRSAKSVGGGINRPKSAAAGQNPAAMDANSRESAKTFMIKNLQPEAVSSSVEAEMESLSIQGDEKKANHGGAVALLRAVSSRSRSRSRTGPSSRGPSPIKAISEEVNHLVEEDNKDSHHYRHLLRHEHKPKQSKHGAYLAKLLTEAPQPTPLAPPSALLWGRRTPIPAEQTSDKSRRKPGEGMDIESQQANTGLVRALNQFTSVEVLDGPNSFACKRCWRMMNPPTAEEDAKLRSRRVRRGKDEDDSERSSDDESSSDEEEKERIQRKEANQAISSASSFTSENDSVKQSRPPVNPHADWTKTVTPDVVRRQAIPSIETSSPQSSRSNGKESDSSRDLTPSTTPRMPMLQAPKAITASSKGLVLGESLSGTSSEEETSDEREGDEPKVKRAASVKFENRQGNTTKQKSNLPMSKGVTKKRSTHSLQRRALKRFLIANTPRVLVFHFKRFQASSRGFNSYSFSNNFKKIDDYVTFPEYLDVKSWLAPPREEYNRHGLLKDSSDARALAKVLQEEGLDHDHHAKWRGRWSHKRKVEKDTIEEEKLEAETKTKYRLYAVVVHQGSMSGGHYTAYVLSDRIHDPNKAKMLDSTSNTPTGLNSSSTSQLQSDGKKARFSAGTTVADSSTSLPNEANLRSSLSMSSVESGNGASSDANSQVSGSEAAESNLSLSKTSSPASGAGKAGLSTFSTSKTSEIQATKGAIPNGANSIPPFKSAEKKKDDRKWIYCSDTMIRGATLDEVLKAQAYMLFYEQM